MLRDRRNAGCRRLRARLLELVARGLGFPGLATVPVSAAILTRLQTVSVGQPLGDVAQVLVANRYQQVPVVDGDQPVGVVTRSDLEAAVQVVGPHAPVALAHHRTVVTVSPSDSIADVFGRLRASPEAVAVVVDHGAPVGVVTYEHLLAYLAASGPEATG
jgi:tRNA nucleotidyltransferase (CCA-adding enzyme)